MPILVSGQDIAETSAKLTGRVRWLFWFAVVALIAAGLLSTGQRLKPEHLLLVAFSMAANLLYGAWFSESDSKQSD